MPSVLHQALLFGHQAATGPIGCWTQNASEPEARYVTGTYCDPLLGMHVFGPNGAHRLIALDGTVTTLATVGHPAFNPISGGSLLFGKSDTAGYCYTDTYNSYIDTGTATWSDGTSIISLLWGNSGNPLWMTCYGKAGSDLWISGYNYSGPPYNIKVWCNSTGTGAITMPADDRGAYPRIWITATYVWVSGTTGYHRFNRSTHTYVDLITYPTEFFNWGVWDDDTFVGQGRGTGSGGAFETKVMGTYSISGAAYTPIISDLWYFSTITHSPAYPNFASAGNLDLHEIYRLGTGKYGLWFSQTPGWFGYWGLS